MPPIVQISASERKYGSSNR